MASDARFRPEVPEVSVEANVSILLGDWAGSFSGFIHDDPPDDRTPPPHLPGAIFSQNKYAQAHGFYPCAGLICVSFKEDHTLDGSFVLNRATKVVSSILNGTYSLSYLSSIRRLSGQFTLDFPTPLGMTVQEFHFVVRNSENLNFLSVGATRTDPATGQPRTWRGTIAQGELSRVTHGYDPG